MPSAGCLLRDGYTFTTGLTVSKIDVKSVTLGGASSFLGLWILFFLLITLATSYNLSFLASILTSRVFLGSVAECYYSMRF